MGRGGAGTGLGAGGDEIPAAGRGYDGFGLRGCDGGGGPEPALAGRRAVEARTGAGGRLGSCPRRNDGKSAGRCSGTFSWGAVWARGCIWSGRFGVVRFGQVWSGLVSRGGVGTGFGAGGGEIPAAGRGYDGFGSRGCDGFGLRGCDGGGGPEPALAGRRAVEARTGAGGRLGSCPRRNDGKSAGRCSGTFSWGAVWARGCIWSGRFGVVRFGQVWSGLVSRGGVGTGFGAGGGEIPAAGRGYDGST